jgi:hypothetical protein
MADAGNIAITTVSTAQGASLAASTLAAMNAPAGIAATGIPTPGNPSPDTSWRANPSSGVPSSGIPSSGIPSSGNPVTAALGSAARANLTSGIGAPRASYTLYFAADRPPLGRPTLALNGDGPEAGIVNTLAEMTAAAPAYAPPGKSLLAASVLDAGDIDDDALELAVREHLTLWFGADVKTWRHLRTYRIPHALPPLDSPTMEQYQRPVHFAPGIYVCGDHRDQPSIQGAMTSGRRVADRVAADWKDLPVRR